MAHVARCFDAGSRCHMLVAGQVCHEPQPNGWGFVHPEVVRMPSRNTAQRDRDRATIAKAKPPCYLCGEPIDYSLKYPDPWCFTVDHVIPIDAGGADHIGNKAAAHWCHNRAKGYRLDGGPTIRRSGALSRPGGGTPSNG